MIVKPNDSYLRQLDLIVADYAADSTLRLFQNDYVPIDTTQVIDLTEATFGGYVPISPAPFNPAFLLAPQMAWSKMSGQVFASDGTAPANTIYGVYCDRSDGSLIWAVRLMTPKVMAVIGDLISVDAQERFGICVSAS